MSRRGRIYQPELSDDDGPSTDPGYHNPSSSKSKTWTISTQTCPISTQTPITFEGFWNDRKNWILIGIFLVFQLMTAACFKHSVENKITNLKSCQKRIANSDDSLSCSDCMCIATDGFSSKEFFDIIENQKREGKKYDKLETAYADMKEQLSEYENKVIKLEKRLSMHENLNKDDHFTKLFNKNWDGRSNTLIEKFEEKDKSLRSLYGEVKKEVNEKSQNLQSQLEQQRENIITIEGKIQPVDEMREKFENTMKEIENQTNTLKIDTQTLKGEQSGMNEKLKTIDGRLDGIDRHLNYVSKENSEIILYIIVFLVVMVIAVILAAPKLILNRQPGTTEGTVSSVGSHPKQRVGGKEMSRTAIYATLSSKRRVRGISIISFHSATQQFHQNLLKFVSRPQALPMQSYLIENQVDLSEVNPYMVTIIFVDFNERNIILENPEIEVGDHRKFTTEIFLELGCDVFVVYCKDRDSQNLPPNQFYNTKLHSINQHATLSKLKKKDRVFSVYKTLHPQQVKLLENCFKQL